MNQEIYEMKNKMPKNFSLSTIELMKSGIFGRYKENEFVDIEYEMFNMKIGIFGKALNSKTDYVFLLYLLKQNKKNITLNINDVLYDLNICNKVSRPNKSRKNQILNSLKRLNSTTIYMKHLSEDFSAGFSFINNYVQDKNTITIQLNDQISSIYKETKFKKYISLEDFIGYRNYDINLINYILTLNKKHCTVNLDTLKKVFTNESKSDIEYRKELKKSLNNLVESKIVGEYEIDKKENIIHIHKNKGGIKSDKLFEIFEDKIKQEEQELLRKNILEDEKNKRIKVLEKERIKNLKDYEYAYNPLNDF